VIRLTHDTNEALERVSDITASYSAEQFIKRLETNLSLVELKKIQVEEIEKLLKSPIHG
jgi:hypothetical protein